MNSDLRSRTAKRSTENSERSRDLEVGVGYFRENEQRRGEDERKWGEMKSDSQKLLYIFQADGQD